jgi:hypothetical protein
MGAAFDKEKLSQNDSHSKLSSPVQEGAQHCVEPEPHYHILFLERQRREPSRLGQNCTFWNHFSATGRVVNCVGDQTSRGIGIGFTETDLNDKKGPEACLTELAADHKLPPGSSP